MSAAPGVDRRGRSGRRGSERWARLLRALRLERPRPHVGIALDASAPAWQLRLLQVAVALGCTAMVATNEVLWVLVAAGLVAMVVRPYPLWQAGFLLAMGAGLLFAPADPFAPRAFVLLFGIHLFVVLGAILGRMPWSARLELRALLASARRFAAIQVFSQLLALAAAWLYLRDVSATWVAVLAGAALAVLAWVVSSRLASPRASRSVPSDEHPERGEDGWAYRLDA